MPELFRNHEGQIQAWVSEAQIIAIFAGWQSGKTVVIPYWLNREIYRCGPGDYGVIAPTIPLLNAKALPELKKMFRLPYWKHRESDSEIVMTEAGELAYFGAYQTEKTRILLKHASTAESVEAFTAKALCVDEPGQIKNAVWEGIQARVAVEGGRILLTSRPYEFNWYVTDIWNRTMTTDGEDGAPYRKEGADPWIECINFSSLANPRFPKAYYDRQKSILPPWVFRMKYDGIPTKPIGLIYTSFLEKASKEKRPDGSLVERASNVVKWREFFPNGMLPPEWTIWVGLDFGKIHTAIILIAEEMEWNDLYQEWEPMTNPRYCVFKEYQSNQQATAREHMRIAFKGMGDDVEYLNPMTGEMELGFKITRDSIIAYGGALGESGWRETYALNGLPVMEPLISGSASVDPQINSAWTGFKTGRLLVCEHCKGIIGDLSEFSVELDKETSEPTEKLKDEAKFHRLAALRSLTPALFRTERERETPPPGAKPVTAYG